MTHTSPPLWKQLMGAGAGALVALAIYGVYEGVSPSIEAYLVPKETLYKETLANTRKVPPQTQARFDRIAKKTRAMVERFESERDLDALEKELADIATKRDTEPANVDMPVVAEVEPVLSPEPSPSLPMAAAVISTMEENSPTLPESGVGVTLGLLAASAGGLMTLWRRKKES